MSVEKHVTDLLPAYALACLDVQERQEVAEHLVGCAACQEDLRAYQAVVEKLPLGVPLIDPPERVKEGLMARVAASPRPVTMVEEPGVRIAARPGPQSFRARENPAATFLGRLSNALRRAAPAWGLASLALVLVLGFSNLLLWQQVNDLRARQPQSMRVVNLSHTDAAPQASGMLVVTADGEHGTLVVDGLPPLTAENQYQLWLIREGKRTSGGVFSVDAEGYGSLWVNSPLPLRDYSTFGITIEPFGGSPGPTGAKVLGGNL